MKEDFLLEIFVKTNASSNFVEWDELSQKHVVSVQDPPVKGKANKRILKTLKAFFSASKVDLVKGKNSTTKICKIWQGDKPKDI